MDEAHKKTQKDLEQLEKDLKNHYRKAKKELEKKFYESVEAFDKADKEMSRKLAKGEITKDQYLQWRLNAAISDERLRNMRNSMTNDLANADKIAAQMINGTLPIAYMDNANYAAYEAESQSGLRTSFTLYSRETIERLMRDEPGVIPQVNPDIPKDERWNRQKLTSALTQGILQGDSIPHIAKRLMSVADMDKNSAIRNARTYTTAAENGGRIDSYQRYDKMGIKMKQEWLAALDTRTRSAHRELDGVQVKVGEKWEVDGYKLRYPGDPEAPGYLIYNCRCTVVGALDGIKDEANKRWSKLPSGMSYKKWKTQFETDMNGGINSSDILREKLKNAEVFEKVQIADGMYMWKMNDGKYKFSYLKSNGDHGQRLNDDFDSAVKEFNKIMKKDGVEIETGETKTVKTKNNKKEVVKIINAEKTYKEKSNINNKDFYKDSLSHIVGEKSDPMAIEDALKGANPGYKNKTAPYYWYHHNCQRCVMSYEARRRGYNVIALPKESEFDGFSNKGNSLNYMQCFVDDSGRPLSSYLISVGAKDAKTLKQNIKKEMDEWGDGSRGILTLKWDGKDSGHVISIEKHGDKIYFIDPQSGSKNKWNDIQYGANLKSIRIARIDDKYMTDVIGYAVKTEE